jgi:outer membrane protein insertion porin family
MSLGRRIWQVGRTLTAAGLLVVQALGADAAMAQDGSRVTSVQVRGLSTIAEETCLARVQTRPGMTYSDQITSEDIRRLYALGYFTDVRVETEPHEDGVAVVFLVKEKPTIGEIQLEGELRMAKSKVTQLLGLKKGDLYDPRKLKDGIDQVKAEYRRKGYSRAEVTSSTKDDPSANTTTLVLVVDPGPRMRVKDVLVEGNLAFSDRRIRKLLKTKTRRWWRPGIYDEQVLEEDVERIRAFYRQHGYQDVTVDHEVTTDPSGKWLYVHFTVTEGQQHRVGDVTLSGNALFSDAELKALLTLKPGAVYNADSLQTDLRTIKQHYGDRGYINAQVTPRTELDESTKRVAVAYEMTENELVYVNRLDVEGNLRTKDIVVRREVRIFPGEPFDGKKIRRSLERLYNLGYFEEVTVDTKPTATPNRDDLVVEVKEAKTGSFSFGGGFSSVDRVVGLVELEQRNFDILGWPRFVGAGQDLRLRAEIGSVRRFFDLSFTEPWIFGYPLSFGADLFNRTRLKSSSLGLAFEEERRGGGIRLGKEFTEQFRTDVGYQLFRTTVSDVAEEASADLKAEAGQTNLSVLGTTLTWDTRDNRFDPTRGLVAFTSGDLAGGPMQGDREFYRFQGGVSTFVPHLKRFVWEGRVRVGIVNEYADTAEVPIFERFFAGGANTIRGFRERRVGPRDALSNDPIGGEAMFIGSVEEVMTLYADERGKPILKGSVFYDVGNVWRYVDQFGEEFESGTGVGMRVNTPIGPVRVDLGFPITQIEDEERRPRIHFNISRSF